MKPVKLAVVVSALIFNASTFAQAPAPQDKQTAAAPATPQRSAEERSASGGQTNGNGKDWKAMGVVGPFGLGMVGTLAVVAGVIVLIAAATDGGDSNPSTQH